MKKSEKQKSNKDDKLEYEDTLAGCVAIKGYHGNSKHVEIPSELNGKKVTSIANYSFSDKGIESVSLPNTIKVIGEEAFYNNQLTEVIIPDSVEVIYSRAFKKNKLNHLDMSENLNQLGSGAFTENNFIRVRVPYSIIQRNEFMEFMLTQGFDAGVKIDIMPVTY